MSAAVAAFNGDGLFVEPASFPGRLAFILRRRGQLFLNATQDSYDLD
jgi:hypothetical protein